LDEPHESLIDRGWAAQELALAQCITKFGHEIIMWECHSGAVIESGSIYNNEDPLRGWLSGLHEVSPATNNPLDDADLVSWSVRGQEGGMVPYLRAWLGTISKYSRMGLTFEQDELVAIAGVTRQLHNSLGDRLGQYLAGLWECGLLL
jgi:hypothetical protein